MFCAICTRDVAGEYRREPLGKGDALVVVCLDCATHEAVGTEQRGRVVNAGGGRRRREPIDMSARAQQIRANRRRLLAAGLCRNGEKHGPYVAGGLCAECDRKRREHRRRAA